MDGSRQHEGRASTAKRATRESVLCCTAIMAGMLVEQHKKSCPSRSKDRKSKLLELRIGPAQFAVM